MKSNVADMVNTGSSKGSSITAALFLKQVITHIFKQLEKQNIEVSDNIVRFFEILFISSLVCLQFVDENVQWLHIDMAGPVWNDKKGGATGFAISTLVEWVLKNSSS